MVKRKKKRSAFEVTWESAFRMVESMVLDRPAIIERILASRDFREALRTLRTGMRFHRWRGTGPLLELEVVVQHLDRPTREEGVYVLHAWHHDRHEFLSETMPVLLLDHCTTTGIAPGFEPQALSILLDYYLVNLLALLALRAWDEGDANSNLDRVTGLLERLQSSSGSGFLFAEDAETLVLLSISQYHPDEPAYGRLLERVRMLDATHQLTIAKVMAAMLGGHLRWGYRDLYSEDFPRLRQDNVIDYPWLLFSVKRLIQACDDDLQGEDSGEWDEDVVRCLLNGLAADPEALLGDSQASLFDADEQAEFKTLVEKHRVSVLNHFERHEPSEQGYSPLSLRFNFPHNMLVAMVICALLQGVIWERSLNQLLVGQGSDAGPVDSTSLLARALTVFSHRPERRDTRGAAQIIYDPSDGLRSFRAVLGLLGS